MLVSHHVQTSCTFFLFNFLLNLQDSPLLSLLVQSTSLPWHQLDLSSYQGILGYVGTHYPPSLLLSADSAPQLLLKSLRSAAGLHPRPNEVPHWVRQYKPVCFTTAQASFQAQKCMTEHTH